MTEYMLRTAGRAAKENGAKKIRTITLSVGIYSGIVPEYVENCFREISGGTAAEGAKLVFNVLPARIRCRKCGGQSQFDTDMFRCPLCGADDFQMIQGREFYIESLEAE